VVSGIAHTATDEKRPHKGFCDKSGRNIVWKLAFINVAIHFAEVIVGDGIHLLAYERWQGEDIAQVPSSKHIELISTQFVDPVRRQSGDPA
jgi:hypothetical protein